MVSVNLLIPQQSTVPVVVARQTLQPGANLAAGDLRIARYPADLVPDSAVTDPQDVVGRSLTAPLAAGAPVTSLGLLGSESLGADAGQVLMPLRMADAEAAALLRPGNRISVFATPTDSVDGKPELLLEEVTVTQVGSAGDSALGSSTGVLITVLVGADDAGTLARAGQSTVSFALLPGQS